MPNTPAVAETLRYRVTGMDCSSCAEKIQSAVTNFPAWRRRASRSPPR